MCFSDLSQMSKWMTVYLICCVWYCILLSWAGGICDMPPCMFLPYQKQPSPKVLDCSGGCLKCLKCAMESWTASSFLMSEEQMKFREQKHCIFNLCPVYCEQQTILGWQSEEFQSFKAQLNHLGAMWPAASVWSGTLWGLPLLALTPLFMKWFQDFSEDFLKLKAPERQKMKRLAVSYLCRVLLPPVFHFIDDRLSREHGWRRVALLPAQIEITIFNFLNGKIFGGPWLNCMLKNTIKENMAMGKHWWREAERQTFTSNQNLIAVNALSPFHYAVAQRYRGQNRATARYSLTSTESSSWLNKLQVQPFGALDAAFSLEKWEQPVPSQ